AALEAGALVEAALDDAPAAYTFVAPTGSVYDVWLFPVDDAPQWVRAELWQGDALVGVGDGTMPALSLRLISGTAYTLRLTGAGRVRLEIARHALSRCFEMPMPLDGDGDVYTKAFARQGDAHWYAVEAGDARPVALAGIPDGADIRLLAQLFDDEGRLLEVSESTAGGACLLCFAPRSGRRYAVRVTAQDGATGLYRLRLERIDGALSTGLTLSETEVLLEGRDVCQLSAAFGPAEAADLLYWESSDPAVAVVDADGRVTGRGAGEAVITAYAAGGARDSCRVSVRYVPVDSVSLLSRHMALSVGDDAAIECDVLPGNASNPRLSYTAEPEGVVEIDRRGVLRGLSEGTCTVKVRALDGGMADALTVEVGPAPKRWRALLVGEQNYASTVAAARTGSINSVSGLRSMLEGLSFNGAKFRVSTLLDVSRDGILAGIDAAFAGAADGDVSLFYITCHGYYSDGMTCFRLYDGSVLTAAELGQALKKVPGEIFAVIDCCGSGGTIGRASDAGDILKGVDAVFGGSVGPATMGGSRFKVLASAALEQDSHRISFGDAASESGMATVFARALCEAGGWSMERSARSAMRADLDYDGAVTLNELYVYVARRVMWYLNLAGADGQYVQTVQVWPEGDDETVFARTL
ncbi:MAG: Ig-like domain-containing protein, partial [Clostridia bacterium]|nr:Ig-like domain-containing protein [Clostridia bacterium]